MSTNRGCCESCQQQQPTLTIIFGPRADRQLDITETRFEVCGLCATAADSHGFVLHTVEDRS